ncbi:MAG: hypothetical protein L0Y58_17175 [Verrucomicrobia subdivision 3 bacterium]|nr:hypothetical protein [Limisphaerales bacterium]
MPESKADPAHAPAGVTDKPRIAWQPFTPGGVAAFADARFTRLFVLQLIVSVLGALAIVWLLWSAWFPAVRESIRNLPAGGAIQEGQLAIPDVMEARLVTNRFLTFVVNLTDQRQNAVSADLYFVLRRDHYEVCSLFGCSGWLYPLTNAPFTRLELEPKWAAWEPFLLGITALAVVFALIFSWWALATAYFVFARVFAFFKDRQVTLGGCWRICGAALLAGAVVLTAATVGYAFSVIDLVRLVIVAVLHVVVPWVLIAFALRARPRIVPKAAANPFTAASPAPNTSPNPFDEP